MTSSFNPEKGKKSIIHTKLRPFKEKARKNIFSTFALTEGDEIDLTFDCHPCTTLHSLVTRKKRILQDCDNEKDETKLALFMEDCYNEDDASFVIKLLEELYQHLHHEDTKAYDISATSIVNYSVFDQASQLKNKFITGLMSSFASKPLHRYFGINLEKTQQSNFKLLRNKIQVLVPHFSFYIVVIFIKAIGLFPIDESFKWKYKESSSIKSKMQCTSLAFLCNCFTTDNDIIVSSEKFFTTFTQKLCNFVEEKKYPTNIETLWNNNMFVSEMKEWYFDYVSANHYEKYFSEEIPSDIIQETSNVITTRSSSGKGHKRSSEDCLAVGPDKLL